MGEFLTHKGRNLSCTDLASLLLICASPVSFSSLSGAVKRLK